jgi:hypothetical protein
MSRRLSQPFVSHCPCEAGRDQARAVVFLAEEPVPEDLAPEFSTKSVSGGFDSEAGPRPQDGQTV